MLRNMWPLGFMKALATTVSYPALLSITNPGAETGDMTGWTQDSGGPALSINTTGSQFPGPRSGSRYFMAANTAVNSTFSQTITIPTQYLTDVDAGNLAVELIGWQSGTNAPGVDYGSLLLECIDSGTTVLASYTALSLIVGVLNYYERKAKLVIPANTRKLRLGTVNTYNSGATTDAYWDDFTISLTTLKTLWTNSGGTGNRTGSITVTATSITAGGGSPSNLVDGSQADSYWWVTATGDGSAYLKFDFGSAKVIDGFRWYQNNGVSHGTWRLEGSNDDSAWTQIGSDFTLHADTGNSGGFFWFSNSTAYRYYRLRHMSGSRQQNPYLREIEFRIS